MGSKRLGVMGGSFDPVHLGHLGIAGDSVAAFDLEGVVFVPAANPPHKTSRVLAPAEDRLRMVELAVAGKSHFTVSDVEIRRDGPSYTIDTLDEMKRERPQVELSFIIGADSLHELHLWYRARELAERHRFIVARRSGTDGPDMEALAGFFGEEGARRLVERFIDTSDYPISATEIRRRVKAGESISDMVPEAVLRYIRERGLYA